MEKRSFRIVSLTNQVLLDTERSSLVTLDFRSRTIFVIFAGTTFLAVSKTLPFGAAYLKLWMKYCSIKYQTLFEKIPNFIFYQLEFSAILWGNFPR